VVVASTPLPSGTTGAIVASSMTMTAQGPSIRAIHLTASAAGSKRYRKKVGQNAAGNSHQRRGHRFKDEGGEVYVPGVKAVERAGSYRREIPDMASWIAELKKRQIYTVGRIVVFKDNIAPRKTPSLAVHNNNGELWLTEKHGTWLDPYNPEAWRYILLIALEASKLDLTNPIRLYSISHDVPWRRCGFQSRIPRPPLHAPLVQFLTEASQLLHPMGVKFQSTCSD